MTKSQLKLLGLALVATGLAGSPLQAKNSRSYEMVGTPEARAGTRVAYQAQVNLECTEFVCDGNFAQLAANRTYEIDRTICYVDYDSPAYVYEVYLSYPAGNSIFYYDLGLDRSSYNGEDGYIEIFAQDGPFTVPKGKLLEVSVSADGGLDSAYCSILRSPRDLS